MAMEDLTSDDQITDLTSEDQTGQMPPTTEQDAAPSDEDAAMEQAFNDVRGVESPAPAPETEEEPPKAEDPEPPEPEASPAPPPVDLAKLQATVQALEQREDKVFGALGAMKQAIDALKSPQRTAASTKVALKRLSQEFPQLAEYLAEDLNDVFQGGQPATPPSTDPAPPETPTTTAPPTDDGPDPVTRQVETRVADELHPGWRDKVRSTDFQGWLAAKPQEEQTKFLTSWSAKDVIGTLKAFDEWKAEATRSKQTKQQRLEAAVAPRGNPQQAPAQTEDDAFEEGFRSVRGRT